MAVEWEKDAPDHWGADLAGFHLACWESSDGWVWEVFGDDADEPELSGKSASLESAQRTAELHAEGQMF